MATQRKGGTTAPRPIVFLVPAQSADRPFAATTGTAARGAAGAAQPASTPGALKASVRLSAQRGGPYAVGAVEHRALRCRRHFHHVHVQDRRHLRHIPEPASTALVGMGLGLLGLGFARRRKTQA